MVSGNNLKVALRRLKLIQEDAAKLIGVSRGTLIKWTGKLELDAETVRIINEKLKIDLHDFHDSTEVGTVVHKSTAIVDDVIAQYEERLREKDERIKDKEVIIELLKQQINSKNNE